MSPRGCIPLECSVVFQLCPRRFVAQYDSEIANKVPCEEHEEHEDGQSCDTKEGVN